MEKLNKEAEEEERKSGKRELEGGKDRMAVVCKRTCCDIHSSMSERFLEKGF